MIISLTLEQIQILASTLQLNLVYSSTNLRVILFLQHIKFGNKSVRMRFSRVKFFFPLDDQNYADKICKKDHFQHVHTNGYTNQ